MEKKTWFFVISLVGMALSAAVLILLIPSLFRSGGDGRIWVVVGLAGLTLVFAAGTRYLRPPTSLQNGR